MNSEGLLLYETPILCVASMSLAGWVFLLKSQTTQLLAENRKLTREVRRLKKLVGDEVVIVGRQRLNSRMGDPDEDFVPPPRLR